jgi:3-deoxy-D-manno-octulosonic-acid transferase
VAKPDRGGGQATRLPMALINARLSARSQRGYARLPSLIGPALASLSAVAAQTVADAERLQQLGARQTSASAAT